MASLLSTLSAVPVAFVDVETTGASPDSGDRVIEVGVARYEGGKLVASYQQLINPQKTISPAITSLTGITNEMVADQPGFTDIKHDLLAMLRGGVVVGHNVPFDLGFLRNEFRKVSIDLAAALPGHHVLDTVRIARKRFGRGGNSLQSLATRLAILDDTGTAHRALADALTTARLLEKLLEPPFLDGWTTSVVDALQAQGGTIRLEGTPKKNALPLELEEALDRGLPVRMDYVDATDRPTSRVVTPVEVRKFRGEMILIAWCALRQDRRTFKLNRIVRLVKIDPDSQVESSVI